MIQFETWIGPVELGLICTFCGNPLQKTTNIFNDEVLFCTCAPAKTYNDFENQIFNLRRELEKITDDRNEFRKINTMDFNKQLFEIELSKLKDQYNIKD